MSAPLHTLVPHDLLTKIDGFMPPNPQTQEQRHRISTSAKLSGLGDALSRLFDEMGQDDNVAANKDFQEMSKARKDIEKLEHDHALTDKERLEKKNELLAAYSQHSDALMKSEQFEKFSAHHQEAFTGVKQAYNAAIGEPEHHGTGLTTAKKEKSDNFIQAARNAHAVTKLVAAEKASIALLDSKNGEWDEKNLTYHNFQMYDQMSAAEKKTSAELAVKDGAAWKEFLTASKDANGHVPEVIQKEYDAERKHIQNMGFGQEFDGSVKERYEEAKLTKGDHDGATFAEASRLIQGIQDHNNISDPKHGTGTGQISGGQETQR